MHVFLIAALTADGFIAKDADHLSTRWTSKEDAQFFSEKTKEAGVVVMGSATFATINRPLPGRLTIVYSSKPENYTSFDPDKVRPTQLEPSQLIEQLASEGYEQVAICGGTSIYTQFMLAGVVDTLYLTTEPVVFGTGMQLFNAPVERDISLKQVISLSDETKVSVYQVKK